MSNLGWIADGIARAQAAGGVELETYRKPGFAGGIGVRRSVVSGACYAVATYEPDPDPADDE